MQSEVDPLNSYPKRMAVPEVNKDLLAQLGEMGFLEARATRALQLSGNSSIEAAINWIVDHENDADIDELPQVPVDIRIEGSDLPSTSEQGKLDAQLLRDRVRKNREEEDKKVERNKEKERIRAGKELQEAKRKAELSERERYIARYEADKEETRRAIDRIRQKLQQDKAERRGRLGLAVEEPIMAAKPDHSLLHGEKNSRLVPVSLPAMSARRGDLMRECLRSLKRHHMEDDAQVKRAFQTLSIYVRNVANNPEEGKFRKIRLSNPAFKKRVGRFTKGVEFLELCGFENTGEFLLLPREEVDMAVLDDASAALDTAVTNPFFGLLSRNVVAGD